MFRDNDRDLTSAMQKKKKMVEKAIEKAIAELAG